jgi:WD40 repeat protein
VIVLQAAKERVERVCFSPDSSSLAVPLREGILIWRHPFAGAPQWELDLRYASGLAFTAGGKKLFVAGDGFRCRDLESGERTQFLPWDEYAVVVAVSPDDRWIVLGQRGADPNTVSPNWREINRLSGRRTRTPGTILWHLDNLDWSSSPLFLPSGSEFLMVEGGWVQERLRGEYRIVTRSTKTGEEVRRSDLLAERPVDWVISPDGAIVAGRVTVWVHVYPVRGSFTKPLATLRNTTRKEYTGIAFHPSGRYLAATSNDATVKLYDTATWEVAKTFTWDVGKMRSIAFSPDGTLAAAGSDSGKVVVWDVDV